MKKARIYSERITVFIIDLLSLVIAFRLAVYLRKSVLPLFYSGFPEELTFSSVFHVWWIFPIWIFFCYYDGLYTKRFSFWDEVKMTWKASFLSTIGIFVIISVGKLHGEISRTVVVLMGSGALFLFPAVRMGAKSVLRRLGFFKRRVLILGAGETGKLIARALRREPNFGYEVIGFVDDDPRKFGRRVEGIKVHRGVDKAVNYIKRCDVEDIFIAMPGAGKDRLQELVNRLQHEAQRILFVPDIFGIAVLGTNLQHFFHEEVLAFEVENNLSNPFNVFVKRCFDLAVCTVLIMVLAVPMLVIALLIRFDSKGRALFFQERIGQRGARFLCFKFRTMYGDADERLAELVNGDPLIQNEWTRNWKLKNDPRVTRIGRFLRMTSLDELPQIFNVIRGDMSLVGPRPYLPRETDHLGDHQHTILLTRPGITGLWQVSGRSETGYQHRITLDLWYVRNWNLWLDVVILLKTVWIVIKRQGAY